MSATPHPVENKSLLLRTGGQAFRLADRLLPHGPLVDRHVGRLRYWRAHGRFPRPPSHPRATFNDLVFDRMTRDSWTPLERACIDKQYAKLLAVAMCPAVRVSETLAVLPLGGEQGLEAARRELDRRAGRMEVAKPTHGSGSVLFLRSAPSAEAIATFCDTAAGSFYEVSRESQYRGQERKIIVEEDLSADGRPPADFKFFCSRGEVLFCQVDVGRFVDHRRVLFTPRFEPIDVRYAHDAPEVLPAKPPNFDAMLAIAGELSFFFDFVRIDLYSTRDAVYFGEFTFAPEGGVGPLSDESFGISVLQRIRGDTSKMEVAHDPAQ